MIRRVFGSGTSWSLWPARRIMEVESFKDKVEPIYRVTDKEDEHQEPDVYDIKGRMKRVRKRFRGRLVDKTG